MRGQVTIVNFSVVAKCKEHSIRTILPRQSVLRVSGNNSRPLIVDLALMIVEFFAAVSVTDVALALIANRVVVLAQC